MVHALAVFGAAAALLVVLPGPDSLLVLRSLVVGGRPSAVRTAAGVLVGLVAWAVAAALGLSALLRASETGYAVLRLAGAAYLVALGASALRSRGGRPAGGHPGLLGTGFRAGLVTNLLNPKIGIFFVTFLPGFVPAGAAVGPTTLLLGAVYVLEGALWFAVLVLLAGRVTDRLQRPALRRRLDRLAGVVLVGLGVRLATEG